MKVAKADLVPTEANLLAEYGSFADLRAACDAFCEEVNARVHRETHEAPAELLGRRTRAAAPGPCRAIHGRLRRHPESSTRSRRVRFGSARYSVPHQLVGERVWVRVDGDELVVAHVGRDSAPARSPVMRSRRPATRGSIRRTIQSGRAIHCTPSRRPRVPTKRRSLALGLRGRALALPRRGRRAPSGSEPRSVGQPSSRRSSGRSRSIERSGSRPRPAASPTATSKRSSTTCVFWARLAANGSSLATTRSSLEPAPGSWSAADGDRLRSRHRSRPATGSAPPSPPTSSPAWRDLPPRLYPVEPAPLPLDVARLLHRLRLRYFREAAPAILARAAEEGWDHAQVLKVLLAEEAAGRDRSTREMHRRAARLPSGKTFDAWDPKASAIPADAQWALRSLDWIGRAENLVLVGPSGTGKSHFAEAIAHAAIDRDLRVSWFTLESR